MLSPFEAIPAGYGRAIVKDREKNFGLFFARSGELLQVAIGV